MILKTLLFFSVIAVQASDLKPPPCEIDPSYKEDSRGNAGCMIQIGEKMVFVRQKYSGKIGLPGGTMEKDESAQCTAHRETWEETGLDVIVGERAKLFDNGFYLYRCTSKGESLEGKKTLPLPEQAKNEITEILILKPSKVKKKSMRFPKQMADIPSLMKTE